MNNTVGAAAPAGSVSGGAETALPDPASNTIAGNADAGVHVGGGSGNRISLNRIFGNRMLGLALGAVNAIVGPVAAARSGPNNLQNYPVLTAVTDASGKTTIVGTLIPSGGQTSYWIEFYANSQLSTGGGLSEGEWFLGAQQFGIGSDGLVDVNYQVTTPADNSTGPYIPGQPVPDHLITAIAIDSNGNTSEFSAARDVLRNAVANDTTTASLQVNAQIPQAYKAALAVHNSELHVQPTNIDAIFQPNKILGVTPSIAQAAADAGVDHFNWLQYITFKPVTYHIVVPDPTGTIPVKIGTKTVLFKDTGTLLFYPVLDPVENFPQQAYGIYNGGTLLGVINPGVPTLNGLPYYYDDKPFQNNPFGYAKQTNLQHLSSGNWLAGKMFAFYDAPTSQNLTGAGGTATFNTALAGVPFANPATPVQWVGLNLSFQWVATNQSTFSAYLPGVIGPVPAGSSPQPGVSLPSSAGGTTLSAAGPAPGGSPSATDAALVALLERSPRPARRPIRSNSMAAAKPILPLAAACLPLARRSPARPRPDAADEIDRSWLWSGSRARSRPGPRTRSFDPRAGQPLDSERSTPGRIRTCDRRIRNPLLYPLSYGVSTLATWSYRQLSLYH